jgi:hypothetical protein
MPPLLALGYGYGSWEVCVPDAVGKLELPVGLLGVGGMVKVWLPSTRHDERVSWAQGSRVIVPGRTGTVKVWLPAAKHDRIVFWEQGTRVFETGVGVCDRSPNVPTTKVLVPWTRHSREVLDAHGAGPPIVDGAAECGISPHELVPDVIETVGSFVELVLVVVEKVVKKDSIPDNVDSIPLLVERVVADRVVADRVDAWDAVSEAMSPRVMVLEPLIKHSKLLFWTHGDESAVQGGK